MPYEPRVGDVVLYRLTPHDCEKIGLMRQAFAHKQGTTPGVGDDIAVVVTRVWHARVLSGQGLLDGNDSLWVPQVAEGNDIGQWRFRR